MHRDHYTGTLAEFIARVAAGEPQDARDIRIAQEAVDALSTDVSEHRDHERCREIGQCWQDREPCPALTPSANADYERALQVVSDLTEGLCGDNLEYERAQLELLADLFGGPEPGLTGRIERIRADIRALAVGLWVVGDQETGERLGVFPSHDKAASFIGGLPGHQDGHYYLDGPCSDLILRDPSAED